MEKYTAKQIRAGLNMTQEEMAKELNVSRQTYNCKEKGKIEFKWQEVKKICQMAAISMDQFKL